MEPLKTKNKSINNDEKLYGKSIMKSNEKDGGLPGKKKRNEDEVVSLWNENIDSLVYSKENIMLVKRKKPLISGGGNKRKWTFIYGNANICNLIVRKKIDYLLNERKS